MKLAQTWAGRLFGTHTGNIAVKLSGDDGALSGVLRHNDPTYGITVYAINGDFDGARLSFQGQTERKSEGVEFLPVKAVAVLQQDGSLQGDWESESGAGGNFVLWPHDGSRSMPSDVAMPDQLHTVRHQFGPIPASVTPIRW